LTLRGTPGVRRGTATHALEIIEDGSLLIQNGRIVSVGSTRRLENLKAARGALEIPAHDCVVMPGLVDPAIRLSLSALAAGGKVKRLKLSDFYHQSVSLMRSCLQHGTLNAGITACSGVPSPTADLSVLRQLARIGNNPIGLTLRWRPGTPDAQIETLHAISRKGLADCLELDHQATNPDADSLLAAAHQAQMTTNLDWTRLNWTSVDSVDLKTALQRSAASIVFCHHNLSPAECETLAGSNATAVFKAGGALFDSLPGGSLRDLMDAGGAVALGSGYDAIYEPNYNMQLVLALAVMRLRLTIEQAIIATTINAAYAMNLGDEIGSLQPGKRADVLVLKLQDYREIPRRMGVNHVAMAIRDGNLAINRTRWRVGAA